jgi:hypothetical protein
MKPHISAACCTVAKVRVMLRDWYGPAIGQRTTHVWEDTLPESSLSLAHCTPARQFGATEHGATQRRLYVNEHGQLLGMEANSERPRGVSFEDALEVARTTTPNPYRSSPSAPGGRCRISFHKAHVRPRPTADYLVIQWVPRTSLAVVFKERWLHRLEVRQVAWDRIGMGRG